MHSEHRQKIDEIDKQLKEIADQLGGIPLPEDAVRGVKLTRLALQSALSRK